jgi:hypothetical protein
LVEVLEYTLVFAISSGLAASGFVLLQGYYPLVSQITTRSEFSQIANSAELALVNNANKTLFVHLNSVSISCRGNLLSLSSPDASYSSALNGYCSFVTPTLKGEHHLTFIPRNGTLTLGVDR